MASVLALLAVLMVFSRKDAAGEALAVYILTGQSNSLGTSNLEASFDPGVHAADSQTGLFWSNVSTSSSDPDNILLYGDSGGVFTNLQPQQGDGVSPSFWGPEFGFARTLFDSGVTRAAIIKLSRGGGGNGFWLPSTGHMHDHMITQIDAALGQLTSAGDDFLVKGFLYLQGESNNAAEAAGADTRLEGLIESVRSHINARYTNAATDMYSVVGEIAASRSNSNRVTTTTLQRGLAERDAMVGFIPTADQPLKGDGIHFGRAAKLEIGRRFADAFNSRTWVENRDLLAGYSANAGTARAVPHPLVQGLVEIGSNSPGVELRAVDSGRSAAWTVVDNSRVVDPGYLQTLGRSDFQRMFDRGWVLTAEAKVIEGGGAAFWSIADDGSDPGWGITSGAGNAVGVSIDRLSGGEARVTLLGSHPIDLGPGSADERLSLQLLGRAGSSEFDFYLNGRLHSSGHSITSAPGVSSYANSIGFRSALRGGTGHEIHWSEVSLVATPEPGAATLALIVCSFRARRRPSAIISNRSDA